MIMLVLLNHHDPVFLLQRNESARAGMPNLAVWPVWFVHNHDSVARWVFGALWGADREFSDGKVEGKVFRTGISIAHLPLHINSA